MPQDFDRPAACAGQPRTIAHDRRQPPRLPAAEAHASPVPGPSISLRIGTVARLNLADFQNAVPALLELVVVNDGAEPLQGLSLQLDCEPAFIQPRTWHLESVAAHGSYALTDLDVVLNGALLAPDRGGVRRAAAGAARKLPQRHGPGRSGAGPA